METITKLRLQVDSIIKYLTPLLPLANCHMVEFLTQQHWETLLPVKLRECLEGMELYQALECFWDAADGKNREDCELVRWVSAARSHCIAADNDICLTVDQYQSKLRAWGGDVKPELTIKEFMTSKKSYEVSRLSALVSSAVDACGARCAVEAGGGRGATLAALAHAHRVPALTVDCNQRALDAARDRDRKLQKRWRAAIRNLSIDERHQTTTEELHRFAHAYVTRRTDLDALVLKHFPEINGDVRILLTGLHTCGNLGPESLRIFSSQPAVSGLLTVPCCYHLLTEDLDQQTFDVFQRDYGDDGSTVGIGFPMSDHLTGFKLGRNARMLAAQSIERVVRARQLPAKSLLYRAMLEVIIKTHIPEDILPEGKLKRIGPKCENFGDYFRSADAILKLDLFDRLPDSYLTDVCKDECDQWKKMVLFNFVRLCLAQVVESVILWDRLLFLYENGFQKAFLVKLFDPVLSPRCHGIAAMR